MQHFKEFLIKLQTLDIQIRQSNSHSNNMQQVLSNYVISHENPFLNVSFKNYLKELKELAVTDILNLAREQILYQLHRIDGIKEIFQKFWDKYYHLPFPPGSEHNLKVVYSLQLNNLFISPELNFMDHAEANESFIADLESTIRHRQHILKEFEEEIFKVINRDKEPQTTALAQLARSKTKSRPVFKEEIADEFLTLIKQYFSESDRAILMKLLTSTDSVVNPLIFNVPGNQLADAFKQLFDSNLLIGCNKAELEKWIQHNFQYRDKGVVKSYTEKYLQDMISSNTKACQSPLFDVRKNDGQFYLSPLARNNRNSKR